MPVVKRLVCLANSRKPAGRCVAGKELNGTWVRPVSDRPSEEVSWEERQYEDGSDPRLLEVIDVPLRNHQPRAHQTENWLLDPNQYWVRVGRETWNNLDRYADNPGVLWVNGSSTYSGSNDRVGVPDAARLRNSLYLLRLERAELRVFAPGTDFGNSKRRVQATFSYHGVDYRIRVTDPLVEEKYLASANGNYPIGECFITVSLAEPYQGYCYKLVAALITPD
jgi:putative nucleic acid modification protein with dual OB domain